MGLSNGFTPAYAGNTTQLTDSKNIDKVHPRIRGEYFTLMGLMLEGRGSPPHTRGIRLFRAYRSSRAGFTPAYAGNTSPCRQ